MNKYFFIILFLSFFAKNEMFAQPQIFTVEEAPFSSDVNDEFSPVYYKDGMVFCSNQSINSLISFNEQRNTLFKIFYVARKGNKGFESPKIFSKELTTNLNDGPVTFNKKWDVIYYSRNNIIENPLKSISDSTNKLGIFSAELIDGIWTNIKAFPYNSDQYSITTPSLAPDGNRIYFSSDMPGGRGGMDLWYCDKLNNIWSKPVNLGPLINTRKNESFPFATLYSKVYFASEGHESFGGKDLFYTQEINGKWIAPVHLDSAFNSEADDFGLITDSTLENGYFSSNRRKTDDIFSFTVPAIEFPHCDSIIENNYCFTFYDERKQPIDTIQELYQWDFGNDIIRNGREVKHCFPGPGEYLIKLIIIDEFTGDTITKAVDYKVELEEIDQAYINSSNLGIVDIPIFFDGLKTKHEGYNVTDYLWDFGEGFKPGGPYMTKSFEKKGEYNIKLGLLTEKDSLGNTPKFCVQKNIKIYNTFQELPLYGEKEGIEANEETNSLAEQYTSGQVRIYFMDDLSQRQISKIEEIFPKSDEPLIRFDQFGIMSDSYPFLENIVEVLKENSDIRLEIMTYSMEVESDKNNMDFAEIMAQELSFYLKNKGISKDRYQVSGFDKFNETFTTFRSEKQSLEELIEFIFMKK
jgi:outer membrane protein OmpA-like peptidoglycan-associated protein